MPYMEFSFPVFKLVLSLYHFWQNRREREQASTAPVRGVTFLVTSWFSLGQYIQISKTLEETGLMEEWQGWLKFPYNDRITIFMGFLVQPDWKPSANDTLIIELQMNT